MLLGTPRITPRLMGYLMVQVCHIPSLIFLYKLLILLIDQTRFALNDVPTWQRFDRAFDARRFYWNVVQFFEDGYGQDVLEHYNLYVFHSSFLHKN